MSMRYPGGIISATAPTVTTTSAKGVWTLEQVAQYVKAGTWPVPIVEDLYFQYNSLLLPGTGTNGGQNNTFIDSSTNNYTMTRAGNTTQGSFSPYRTLWSNYFDGSGDYLSVPDNAALEGFTDFTIEGWVYVTDFSSGDVIAAKGWTPGVYTPWMLYFSSTDLTFYASSTLSSWNIASGDVIIPNIQKNTWYHFAVSRSGSSLRLFSNGSLTTTVSTSTTIGTNADALTIGASLNGDRDPAMYLSNFRINTTAIYTANFTPSTTPLTAITGTSLLTCQSNRFIDNSSNAFTITPSGATSVQAFNPFKPTVAYSTTTNGGSGYFDGTGDYLNTSTNFPAIAGSTDFTIEFWQYPIVSSHYKGIFDINQYNAGILVRSTPGYGVEMWMNGNQVLSTNKVRWNAWNHIVIQRNGTQTYIYINGSQEASSSLLSGQSVSANIAYIGSARHAPTTEFMTGYLCDLRVVVGSNAYPSGVTVPTSPLTAITNTALLLNFRNGAIYDATSQNDLETAGNAQINTSVYKWIGGSISFDGTGDYLVAANSPNTTLGTGDFTVECWVYPTNGAYQTIVCLGRYTFNAGVLRIQDNNTVRWYFNDNSVGVTTTNTVTPSSWNHVCACRSGTTTRVFINGVQGGLFTDNSNYNSTYPTIIAGEDQGSSPTNLLIGYLQDLRITKGVARYTTNFTPPGTAFPLF